MAFRLRNGLKDPLRQTLLSDSTAVEPGVLLDGFDHGGALADAFYVLRGRFLRECDNRKLQQGLHDRAPSTIRVELLVHEICSSESHRSARRTPRRYLSYQPTRVASPMVYLRASRSTSGPDALVFAARWSVDSASSRKW